MMLKDSNSESSLELENLSNVHSKSSSSFRLESQLGKMKNSEINEKIQALAQRLDLSLTLNTIYELL